MKGDWRIQIERGDFDRQWTIRAARLEPDGSTAVLAGGGLFLFEPHKFVSDDMAAPLLKTTSSVTARGFLQAMVDAAWSEGIRPSELEDWKAKTNGTAAHLNDMRAIVAKQLDVKLP